MDAINLTNLSLKEIDTFLTEALERVEAIEHKVKHGKYKIQRKSVKDQVLDGKEPRDIKRENICKNARKKAHTDLADTKKEISQDTRDRLHNCKEGLEIVNESADTISGMYGLDFMEESVGWDVDFTFFDKPQVTPLSESLDVGTTKTGRKKKCKALGVAEGVFAPIIDATGERVFSRNNRLYESDHWEYQLENLNFYNKVHSRRMLGMIGHEDKKITDKDLRDGKVSHVVTDLEIREDDEHGKYLWGRLEILNTDAGRNLKEYYEQDIPMFVSSRGGGKLLDIPGQNYKKVDKTRYYCECFDVVKDPGFLEAAPIYHPISEEVSEVPERISKIAEGLGIEETKLLEVIENVDNRINEDKNMSKVDCNIDTTKGAEDIIAQLLKPISEKITKLSDKIDTLESDLSEATEEPKSVEEPAEEKAEEAPAEEIKEENEEPAEEKAEEAPAEEKEEAAEAETAAEEVSEAEDKCECGKEECPKCGKKEDKKDEEKKECSEAAPAEGDKVTDADAAKADLAKNDKKVAVRAKEEAKKEISEDAEKEEPEIEEISVAGIGLQTEEIPAEETANEEWAKEDPKETAPAIADLPKPPLPNGGGAKDLGEGAWAKEDPKETAPEKASISDGKNPAKTELEAKVEGEIHAEEKKDAAAINAGIEGGAGVTAHESVEETEEVSEAGEESEESPVAQSASEFTQQVTDYKALYEALKDEFDKCNQEIDELLESIESFSKRHREVVQENETKTQELDSIKEQLSVANKSLNSYKLQEKFNITVEKANELLSSQDYETVVEELKAAEAQKIEEEAQATADAVSESLSEATKAAPVSVRRRQAYSAFSATISESKDEEKISESVDEQPKRRRRAYSAF